MDVGRVNSHEGNQCRQCERRGGEEYHSIRQKISDRTHDSCCEQAPRRLEALIAPQPFGESEATHDSKADGDNSRPEKTSSRTLQHQGSEYEQKVRANCNDQRSACEHESAGADKEPFRPGNIEELPSRYLGEQSGNSGRTEDKTDVLLRPPSGSEKYRHEWSKAGQDSRNEEVDTIESAQGLSGRQCVHHGEFAFCRPANSAENTLTALA